MTPPVKTVLIDMEGVNHVDQEGSDILGAITNDMKNAGVDIHLACLKQAVKAMLDQGVV